MDHTFHSDTLHEVLSRLETDQEQGLSLQEGEKRLAEHGENRLEEAKQAGMLRRVLGQLKDPMILVLLAAAALSFFAGGGQDWLDAAIILLIVLFNTVISVSQEDNARKALEALRKLSAPKARVIREGLERRLESSQLVPGDIILLEAGDYVPADGRVLWEAGLQADESAMTGESLPVHKRGGGGLPQDTPLAERKNMVIGGTVITGGRGRVVVTATGMDTEMGKIAGLLLRQTQGETPLQRKMGEVSKVLSLVCVGVCAVMFGVGMLQHRDILDMFLTAVALAVAAIPEGLPAIVTIVLAMGVGRMAKRNAIIKRLPAVETLGCASVICSDKTGTLTKNQMTVLEVWTPSPGLRGQALALGTLCGDAKEGPGGYVGDPTETAIAQMAAREGLEKAQLERDMPRQGEAPFDSVRKRMATCHSLPAGGTLIAVKGAPEAVLSRCTQVQGPQGPRPMTEADRRRILGVGSDLAAKALRVLAVAQRNQSGPPKSLEAQELERELIFVGLIGMMDPPRPEVRAAVERCAAAGVRPVMITGDHKDTAVAIARDLNLFRPGDKAIDGPGLDFLPQETLEEEIETFSVYARVTPEHKMRIVRAWQKKGHVVAMTGDGVNDAPALKAADIGVAMGITGTEVAKDAAGMVLTDDNFATIVQAVKNGRNVYANIRRSIQFLLSGNMAGILTVLYASLLALPVPFAAVHLLFINLLTDSLPAIALGLEPHTEQVMHEKPRPRKEGILTKPFLASVGLEGLVIAVGTIVAFHLGLRYGGEAAGATMAFATLCLSRLFHGFNCKAAEPVLFTRRFWNNKPLLGAFLVGALLLSAVLVIPPLEELMQAVALPWQLGLAIPALAVGSMVVIQLLKAIRVRLRKAS